MTDDIGETPQEPPLNPELPREIFDFESIPGFGTSEARPTVRDLKKLLKFELSDIRLQYHMKWISAIFFGFLLILQHAAIAIFVIWSISADKLSDLQPIFVILAPATLTETFFIARLIVDRMYTPIDYERKWLRFLNKPEK